MREVCQTSCAQPVFERAIIERSTWASTSVRVMPCGECCEELFLHCSLELGAKWRCVTITCFPAELHNQGMWLSSDGGAPQVSELFNYGTEIKQQTQKRAFWFSAGLNLLQIAFLWSCSAGHFVLVMLVWITTPTPPFQGKMHFHYVTVTSITPASVNESCYLSL